MRRPGARKPLQLATGRNRRVARPAALNPREAVQRFTAQALMRKTRIQRDVMSLLAKAVRDRRAKGVATYGTTLRPDNGRDHLLDARDEAIDLAAYLTAEMELRRLVRDDRNGLVGLLNDERMRRKALERALTKRGSR